MTTSVDLSVRRTPKAFGIRIRRSHAVILAGALLVVAAGVWVTVGRARHTHARTVRAEERRAMLMDMVGMSEDNVVPIPNGSFVEFSDTGGVEEVMPALEERFFIVSAQTPGLGKLTGESRRAFAEAAVLALEPFLADDFEMHMRHVEQLGGTLPDTDPDPEEAWRRVRFRWEFNSNRFVFTALAADRAQVDVRRTPSQRKDKFSYLKAGFDIGMAEPGGHTTKTTERFPGLKGWDEDGAGLAVYEARVPVRFFLKKLGQTRLGMLGVGMAQHPETGLWQPAEIRFIHDDAQDPEFHSREEVEAYMEILPGNLWM